MLAVEGSCEPGVNLLLDLCVCPGFGEGASGMEAGDNVERCIATVSITWDRVPVLEVRVVVKRDGSGVFGEVRSSGRKPTPISGCETQEP